MDFNCLIIRIKVIRNHKNPRENKSPRKIPVCYLPAHKRPAYCKQGCDLYGTATYTRLNTILQNKVVVSFRNLRFLDLLFTQYLLLLKNEIGKHHARVDEEIHKQFFGKSHGRRPRCRWKDDIKLSFIKISCQRECWSGSLGRGKDVDVRRNWRDNVD